MGRYSAAARLAADLTNKELGAKIAVLAPVTNERIQTLLPTKRDKEAFVQLMMLVEAETTMDNQLAFLRDNLATAGKSALMALRIFI
jgi:hypothetical protein